MNKKVIKNGLKAFLIGLSLMCVPSFAYAKDDSLVKNPERVRSLKLEGTGWKELLKKKKSRAKKEINLNDFLTVTFDGYDGYGWAKTSFDYEAFSRKYDRAVDLTLEANFMGYFCFSDLIKNCTEVSIVPNGNLSNGDKVTASWDVEYGDINGNVNSDIAISTASQTFTVKGLGEMETFDAFEGVTVEFSGISPDVKASVSLPQDRPESYYYLLSQSEGLSIGDTLTVTIGDETIEEYARESGRRPAQMSREYTVEGVPYYVASPDEIPDENMDKMKSQAEDVLGSTTANWDENVKLDSVKYIGNYFLYKKPDFYTRYTNVIYLIYEIHATQFGKNSDGSQSEKPVDYYWYIGFHDGIVLEDDLFSIDYSDYSMPSGIFWEMSDTFSVSTYDYTQEDDYMQDITEKYFGYEDLDSMFNNLVTAQIDSYTYESTIDSEV